MQLVYRCDEIDLLYSLYTDLLFWAGRELLTDEHLVSGLKEQADITAMNVIYRTVFSAERVTNDDMYRNTDHFVI